MIASLGYNLIPLALQSNQERVKVLNLILSEEETARLLKLLVDKDSDFCIKLAEALIEAEMLSGMTITARHNYRAMKRAHGRERTNTPNVTL